jgi:hypothetical protein
MRLSVAQKKLARLWFVGAIGILLIMIARLKLQHAFTCPTPEPNGRPLPPCDPNGPWRWWSSAFLPTLLLMVGALTATSDAKSRHRSVDHFTYLLVLWTSAIYLLLCLLLVLAGNTDTSAALDTAMWIPPLQSLVTVFLGRLFASSGSDNPD